MIAITTSSNKSQFVLNFHEKVIVLSFCELLSFRNKIDQIDIVSHFYSDHNAFGIEIITLCNLQHLLILETSDLLKLKDIMHSIFTEKAEKVLY
ncbi:MAG: hypothetical protein HRT67_08720 [Flavobacteriaceae bacterium]|nr:hypothetical protein [Flavobacteriaceae bacterium]